MFSGDLLFYQRIVLLLLFVRPVGFPNFPQVMRLWR